MESRIVLSRHDLERLRPLLSARGSARATDREYLLDLEQEIDRAAIVENGSLPAGVVAVGSTATLLDIESGKYSNYTLVLPAHADVAEGRISVLAPLGTALLGYRVGDVVEWRMPGGMRRVRIEAVQHDDEPGGEPSTRHQ
jgi:regulator of nucleoside diphosphate kinase